MPPLIPTYDQIMELSAQSTVVVPPEFIDENGHMNISRYVEVGGQGLWFRCLNELGMPKDYIQTRGFSTFTAEHHVQYLAEILEGEEISVHSLILARSDKVLHAVSLIVNQSRRQLSCVLESTLVHMDMNLRRPTPFPEDVAALIDQAIKTDDVAWPVPLTGSMGIRKS